VCLTVTRGKQPSAIAFLIMENVAEIIAWLAMIAAPVDTANIGQKIGSAPHIM